MKSAKVTLLVLLQAFVTVSFVAISTVLTAPANRWFGVLVAMALAAFVGGMIFIGLGARWDVSLVRPRKWLRRLFRVLDDYLTLRLETHNSERQDEFCAKKAEGTCNCAGGECFSFPVLTRYALSRKPVDLILKYWA